MSLFISVLSNVYVGCVFSMCCIAPVIAAKMFHGCEVTVGHNISEGGRWPYADTAQAIASMGAVHINRNVTISF